MSDRYGEHLVNDAKRGQEKVLKGTWEFNGDENALEVRNIAQPDMELIREYASIAGQFQHLAEKTDEGEELTEEDAEAVKSQAENLSNFSWEDDDAEKNFIVSAIDEKLVSPEVDTDGTSEPVLHALFEGMLRAWNKEKAVREAEEEMPVEGNP